MAQTGNTYTVQLKPSHLAWGVYRNPTNRNLISGEGYIKIPKTYAVQFGIFNSNNNQTGLGYNQFYADSSDGFLKDVLLLAQGSSTAGDIYAKQFSVQDDLKRIGQWYQSCNATTANSVKVTFTSPTHIFLEII